MELKVEYTCNGPVFAVLCPGVLVTTNGYVDGAGNSNPFAFN